MLCMRSSRAIRGSRSCRTRSSASSGFAGSRRVPVQVDGGIGRENVARVARRRCAACSSPAARVFGAATTPRPPTRSSSEPRRTRALARALELAERGRGRRTRTRSSAPSSFGTARSWARDGTSATASRTPRRSRSRPRASARAVRRSTSPWSRARTTADAAVRRRGDRRGDLAGGRGPLDPNPEVSGGSSCSAAAGVEVEVVDAREARARTRPGAPGSRSAARS